jgi:hypothetical protein
MEETYNICPYISDQQLNCYLKVGNCLEEYAHENGFGENGSSPIKALFTVIMHMSSDYEQLKDEFDKLKLELKECKKRIK